MIQTISETITSYGVVFKDELAKTLTMISQCDAKCATVALVIIVGLASAVAVYHYYFKNRITEVQAERVSKIEDVASTVLTIPKPVEIESHLLPQEDTVNKIEDVDSQVLTIPKTVEIGSYTFEPIKNSDYKTMKIETEGGFIDVVVIATKESEGFFQIRLTIEGQFVPSTTRFTGPQISSMYLFNKKPSQGFRRSTLSDQILKTGVIIFKNEEFGTYHVFKNKTLADVSDIYTFMKLLVR